MEKREFVIKYPRLDVTDITDHVTLSFNDCWFDTKLKKDSFEAFIINTINQIIEKYNMIGLMGLDVKTYREVINDFQFILTHRIDYKINIADPQQYGILRKFAEVFFDVMSFSFIGHGTITNPIIEEYILAASALGIIHKENVVIFTTMIYDYIELNAKSEE